MPSLLLLIRRPRTDGPDLRREIPHLIPSSRHQQAMLLLYSWMGLLKGHLQNFAKSKHLGGIRLDPLLGKSAAES